MDTGVFAYPNERLTFVLMRGEKKPSHPQVYKSATWVREDGMERDPPAITTQKIPRAIYRFFVIYMSIVTESDYMTLTMKKKIVTRWT